MKSVKLFCDGSSLGNPGYGGYCGILQYADKEKIIAGGEENSTNNQMELKAVIESLKCLKEPCNVELYSDSKYVCDGISSWLDGWVKKDFDKIKNPDLWREYVRVSRCHHIKTIWVKGHNGHIENERCDKIAKEWALKYKKVSNGQND
ncbi:ribonuclease HI [Helicobacter cappadocius]|uniref:ribonuclease H n=1 Tax=Helicobacter cappadocius TaxID=3063998 RepID=A0AA90PX71_9HELI|nr:MULTISPECIES: ribonuclease HI [unclassified Helicobacter]MDO7252366.1 ribonuclease HI [Helicobacter sp. faydin-H75]MDP2538233.1 ribonuclease HI [Helicobacter sp. faydin-H76]